MTPRPAVVHSDNGVLNDDTDYDSGDELEKKGKHWLLLSQLSIYPIRITFNLIYRGKQWLSTFFHPLVSLHISELLSMQFLEV